MIASFLFAGALFEFFLFANNKKIYITHRVGYTFLFLFLIFFCGFRGQGVDRDYPEYLNILKQIPPFPDVLFYDLSDVHGDPILYLISSMINGLGAPSYFLFFTFSTLSLTIYWRCFLKSSSLPWLSLFIYFCHSFLNKEMTQIRNGLSSAFILLALCYIGDKKNIKAYFTFLLSFLAHSSGIVSFLIVFYKRATRYKNSFYYFGFAFSFFMYFTWHSIFLMLPQDISIVQKVNLYLAWDSYNYSLSLLNPILLRQIGFFILFLYIKDKYFWDEKLNPFLFSYFLSICFYITFNDIAILGARLSNMLACSEYILVPYSISTLLKNNRLSTGLAVFFIVVMLSVLLLYVNLEIKNIFSDYETVLDL
ncbi:EpsG family protein [Aeromonas sp. AE23HZ002T15]